MNKEEIKKRCFDSVIVAVGPVKMNDKVSGSFDYFEFEEILAEVEREFNETVNNHGYFHIKEGETTIDDFDTVSNLVDWLADHVAKHPW